MKKAAASLAYEQLVAAYLPDEEREDMVRYAKELTCEHLAGIIEGHTQAYELSNGQRYRTLVVPGESRRMFAMPMEYATGLTPASVGRALLARQMFDPEATLVVQPNDTATQPNLNFSKEERRQTADGDFWPVTNRLVDTLDRHRGSKAVAVAGFSQGSAVALALAARPDVEVEGAAVVELPNLNRRRSIGGRALLGYHFLVSGDSLTEAIQAGSLDREVVDASFADEARRLTSLRSRAMFMRSTICRNNLALFGALAGSDAFSHMRLALNNSPLVHAWSEHGGVSSKGTNEWVAARLRYHPNYEGIELAGVNHAVANLPTVLGALARRAAKLP